MTKKQITRSFLSLSHFQVRLILNQVAQVVPKPGADLSGERGPGQEAESSSAIQKQHAMTTWIVLKTKNVFEEVRTAMQASTHTWRAT